MGLRFLVSRFGAAVLQAVVLIVVARGLGAQNFGSFGATAAIGAIVTTVCSFGAQQRVLRSGAADRDKVDAIYTLLVLATLLALTVSVVLSSVLRNEFTGVQLLGGLSASVDSLALFGQNVSFGALKPGRALLGMYLVRVISLAGALMLIVPGPVGIPALGVAYVCACITSGIVARLRPRRLSSFAFYREGYNFWATSVWGMLQQLDVVMVSVGIGVKQAGAYSAAYRLASPLHLVTGALNSIYTPRLSSTEDSAVRWRDGVRLTRIGAAYAAALIVLSPSLLWLGPAVLGSSYKTYTVLFPVLVVNGALNVVAQLLTSRLYAEHLEARVQRVSRTATVTGLLYVAIGCVFHEDVRIVSAGTVLIQVILIIGLRSVLRKEVMP